MVSDNKMCSQFVGMLVVNFLGPLYNIFGFISYVITNRFNRQYESEMLNLFLHNDRNHHEDFE